VTVYLPGGRVHTLDRMSFHIGGCHERAVSQSPCRVLPKPANMIEIPLQSLLSLRPFKSHLAVDDKVAGMMAAVSDPGCSLWTRNVKHHKVDLR
jgi:hypothetical protein